MRLDDDDERLNSKGEKKHCGTRRKSQELEERLGLCVSPKTQTALEKPNWLNSNLH